MVDTFTLHVSEAGMRHRTLRWSKAVMTSAKSMHNNYGINTGKKNLRKKTELQSFQKILQKSSGLDSRNVLKCSINPQQETRGWFLVEGVIFKLGWGELVLDKFKQYFSLYLTVVQHTLVPVVQHKKH